ncbi:carbonic anhydrase [Oceanicella sp. SM1341]|uniref:carbonic anhydrase n=1 Tax=Oceanicella sp. SM1341 TaxID=1548889 RepID=UPI0013007CC2|nr:carbonic anhydrase family protein [Oceanicella sp. SM1341]
MPSPIFLVRSLALGLAFLLSPLSHAAGQVHWDYSGQGGPSHWGDLSADWEDCRAGHQQSPIDIGRATAALLLKVELHWQATEWTVINNGHTIQVNGASAGYAMIDGARYELLQFHFHAPSEHTVGGAHFPMEVHFVHADAEGRLAVIGVMLQAGGNNSLFRTLMFLAPKEEGAQSPAGQIEPLELVSDVSRVIRYQGSLTTPPCSETVLWTVLKQPVFVNQRDIDAFTALFPMNARPVQPLFRRFVLEN